MSKHEYKTFHYKGDEDNENPGTTQGYTVTEKHTVLTLSGETEVVPGDVVVRDFAGAEERGLVNVVRKDAVKDSFVDSKSGAVKSNPAS